jgi:hypothetical protein
VDVTVGPSDGKVTVITSGGPIKPGVLAIVDIAAKPAA